jgi:YbgC/YbaW family acyl-CoA thioester hydrolase
VTLFLRMAQSIARGSLGAKITRLNEPARSSFHVLPIDLDINRHMNNAKYLNYMEAARWNLTCRLGFMRVSIEKGWYTPVSKIEVRYRRPLTVFQAFDVTAQIVKADEQWLYIYQELTSRNQTVATALVRMKIKEKKRTVPASEYFPAVGFQPDGIEAPAEIKHWLDRFSNDD